MNLINSFSVSELCTSVIVATALANRMADNIEKKFKDLSVKDSTPPPLQEPPPVRERGDIELSERFMSESIVIFGEGNFSFAVALACVRGSNWNGLTITALYGPLPSLADVKVINIKWIIENLSEVASQTLLDNIKKVIQVGEPPIGTWRYGVDATDIPADLYVCGKIVWFQCPWIPRIQGKQTTYELIQGFMRAMSSKQRKHDLLLIGFTEHKDYVDYYKISDLKETYCESVGYRHLTDDDEFIKKILLHGYKHEAVYDIHRKIYRDHKTLVFEKQ